MNKVIIGMFCIIIIMGAILTGLLLNQSKSKEITENISTEISKEEIILDDCTDEYESFKTNTMLEANSNEEKISPNCSLIQKIYYEQCSHTIIDYPFLPTNLVNLTKEQLQSKYPDWNIEKFSSNEIILSKEKTGECGEHFLVKENNGKVTIYQIDETGQEHEWLKTEIATEYLTETDKLNIQNGIRVNGNEELNQLIENFE